MSGNADTRVRVRSRREECRDGIRAIDPLFTAPDNCLMSHVFLDSSSLAPPRVRDPMVGGKMHINRQSLRRWSGVRPHAGCVCWGRELCGQ
ncbi:hypothetical protein J6590_025440 [Homalodisca vitripennis]|nr:hypothetical protein J6590_025440 [Homalodisca vitripennis]